MTAGIEPIGRRSRFVEVMERVQALIDGDELAAGDRLPSERELALALGVHRSSVREALRALATAGVVDIQHGRGVFVRASASPADRLFTSVAAGEVPWDLVPDLLEARRLAEGALVELAAERASAAVADRLDALVADLAAGLQRQPVDASADDEFHVAVAEASGNQVLAALVSASYTLGRRLFADYALTSTDAQQVVARHREIAERIRAGDGPGARAAAESHLDETAAAWLAWTDRQPSRRQR